jgi:RHS repeat-associated protein
MAGSCSVYVCAGFAFAILQFIKRRGTSLGYLSILVPGLVFAQAQMSTPGLFAVSASGAATYTIPIQAPPGTAGMRPSLALTYNSQAGNGLAGMGWSLSGLSAIHRCPRTFVQDGVSGGVNYDANDRFCLDGERLILVGGTYGAAASEYRTEHESFSKVTMLAANDFEVRAKSGQIMHYRAMLAAPPKNTTAALWVLDEVKDRAGNYLKVYYGENNSIGEFWPHHIEYTGNTTMGSSPSLSVYFKYVARGDVETSYGGGAVVTATQRLSHIKTCIGTTECISGASLIKDYALTYQGVLSPSTNRSRLQSIAECDSSGNCLASTDVGWQDGGIGMSLESTSTYFGTGGTPQDRWFTVSDVNSDGKADAVKYEPAIGNVTVALSTGSGAFAATVSTYFGVGGSPVDRWFTMADVNDDGKADAVRFEPTNGNVFVALANSNGGFAPPVSTYFGMGGSPADRWFTMTDVNGDGKADAVRFEPTNGNLFVALANSNGGFAPAVSTYFGTGGSPADRWFMMTDVNGDGKVDAVRFEPAGGNVFVALSTGNGAFTSAIVTYFGSGGSPADRWFAMADVNGDGRADLMRYEPSNGNVIVSLANGIGGFGLPTATYFGTGGTPLDRWFEIGDSNGDGKSDAIRYEPASGTTATMSAVSPIADLVTNITTTPGVQTTINYKPLTNASIYTKLGGSTWPLVEIQAAIYGVSNTSSSNGIGGTLSSTYAYAGLKAHALGRGLLGFRSMTVTNDQTGIVSTSIYAQEDVCAFTHPVSGYPDYACTGTLLSSESKLGATYIGKTTSIPAYTSTYPGVYFSYASGMTGDVYGVSDALTNVPATPITSVTTTMVFGESTQYGNPTKITVDSGGGYVKVTDNVYSNNSTDWILGRLTAAAVTSTNPTSPTPTQTRVSSFTYNSLGFLGSETIEPCPRPVFTGLTISAPCDSALTLATTYGYDGFGNKTSVTVSGGTTGASLVSARTTTTSYAANTANPVAGRFPTSTTNALNQTETREFDNRFGGMIKLTGPNLIETNWTYDAFGRKFSEVRQDGTRTDWTYSATAGSIQAQAYRYSITATSTGAPTVTSYFDILNRAVVSSRANFDGANIYTVTEYDSLGWVKRSSRPYLTGTIYWSTPTYDILGRVQTESHLDGAATSTVTYDYNGQETTTTKSTGRTSIPNIVNHQFKNTQGQLIKVINAEGSATPSQITYEYDAFGNLLKTLDQTANRTSSMVYNIRGFKTSMYDLNMNSWSYTYDALGQLKTQVDGKTQSTSMTYDLLGRMTARATSTFTSNWYYDKYANNAACNKGQGKLCEVTTTNGFRRTFLYDSLGRSQETTTYLNGIAYSVTNTYGGCANGVGKVCSVEYPFTYGTMARVKVNNNYNTYGYLTSITDAANSAVLWSLNGATAMDADGNIRKETLGNGLITDRIYNIATGRIQSITTGGTGSVQNLSYGFDHLGDLTSRDDGVNNVNEIFTYDALNRLTNTSMTGATALTKSYGYSSTGNLNYKSDVGTLVYPLSYEVKHHAVKSVTGTVNGLVNPTYTYDSVGNLTEEKTGTTVQRSITWTGFNMPLKITKGVSTIEFLYDADHARVYEARKTGVTFDSQTYFVNAGNALFFEIETKGTITEWKHYLHAPSGLLMMRSIKSNTTAKTDVYFHKDHLGSITTITNNIGAILEQNSFDAFGKRRNSNGSDATTTINSLTRRGFTQHEMLPEVNLIHMNGRVYEPTLGRFMSADPFVQYSGFSQSYNRYSYGFNNPLSGTDPSGYGWFSKHVKAIGNFLANPFDAQRTYRVIQTRADGGAHDRFMMTHSWARAVGYAVAA